ncbi:MAG: hypothetical protein V7641_2881 [Blastocatellia bacterium]
MRDAGIEPTWLVNYLATTDNKEVYAQRIGASKGCWKQMLLARLLGSGAPSRVPDGYLDKKKKKKKRKSAVVKIALEDCDYDVERANSILARFQKETREFGDILDHWYEYLLSEEPGGWFYKNRKKRDDGYHVYNKLGFSFNVTKAIEDHGWHAAASKLVSHRLFGEEQAFIIQIINISPGYQYLIYCNEHDGVVSKGIIPPEAIDKASKDSGVPEGDLILKEWAPPEI